MTSAFPWNHDQIGVVTNAWPEKEAGALLSWAVWAADSLSYWADLDALAFGSPRHLLGYEPDQVDAAHLMATAATCATSIDRCAAVLGRRYCGKTGGGSEFALSSFFDRTKGKGNARQAKLPPDALTWLLAVSKSSDQRDIRRARNEIVHGRVTRLLLAGTSGRTRARTQILLQKAGRGRNPKPARYIDAGDVVQLARSVSVTFVGTFLDGVMSGRF